MELTIFFSALRQIQVGFILLKAKEKTDYFYGKTQRDKNLLFSQAATLSKH